MARCPQCLREIAEDVTQCPNCRAAVETSAAPPFRTITRLTSAAEAGYFADVLSNHEIPCRLHHEDQFSAVDGTWNCDYYLQVPEPEAVRAAQLLQQELGDSEPTGVVDCLPDEPASPIPWMPVVLVLVAGGVAYWATQAGPVHKHRPEPEGPTLVDVLQAIDAPLATSTAAGQAGYRLQVRDNETVYLDEDRDGDGVFESRLRFRNGRAVGPPEPIGK